MDTAYRTGGDERSTLSRHRLVPFESDLPAGDVGSGVCFTGLLFGEKGAS